MTRTAIIRSRWLELLLHAVLALAVWSLLLSIIPDLVQKVAQVPLIGVVSFLVLILVSLLVAGWGRLLAFTGLRHPLTYPPLWFAGVFGCAVLLLLLPQIAPQPALSIAAETAKPLCRVALSGVGCCVVVVVLGQILGRLAASPPSPESTHSQQGDELATFETLINWIRDDRPLTSPGADRFNFGTTATRIARHIVAGAGSQAVVGDLGSGKSTLMNLVDYELKASGAAHRVRLVPVELWQYSTPAAAVGGIVRAAVSALAEEVNVLPIAGLPGRYLSTMTAAGGVTSALAKLIHEEPDPFDALGAIDRVLVAIDLRLCIWVEDLERYAGEGAGVLSPKTSAAELGANRLLNPIRAVLHGLDRLEQVSVVAATTNLRSRLDVDKIARFVEDVPPLTIMEVCRILHTFREGSLKHTQYIESAKPGARKEFDRFNRPAWIASQLVSLSKASASSRVAQLGTTPRALKVALRLTWDTWEPLCGEVDFDDLLAISFLRARSPDAFAEVRSHLHELYTRGDAAHHGHPEGNRTFQIDLETALGNGLEWAATLEIVDFIFDKKNRDNKPQGLGHNRYWQRYMNAEPIQFQESDQRILSILSSKTDDEILDLLESDLSGIATHFEHLLGRSQVINLVGLLTRRRAAESPSAWAHRSANFDRTAPALSAVSYFVRNRRRSGELSQGEVRELYWRNVEYAASRNLQLAMELEGWFAGFTRHLNSPLNPVETDELPFQEMVDSLQTNLRESIRACYQHAPSKLAAALKDAHEATLLWTVYGSGGAQESNDEPTFWGNHWNEFSSAILETLKNFPHEMLPQVARLLVKMEERTTTKYEFIFSQTRAKTLFDVEQLWDALGAISVESSDDWSKALLAAMPASGVERLSE